MQDSKNIWYFEFYTGKDATRTPSQPCEQERICTVTPTCSCREDFSATLPCNAESVGNDVVRCGNSSQVWRCAHCQCKAGKTFYFILAWNGGRRKKKKSSSSFFLYILSGKMLRSLRDLQEIVDLGLWETIFWNLAHPFYQPPAESIFCWFQDSLFKSASFSLWQKAGRPLKEGNKVEKQVSFYHLNTQSPSKFCIPFRNTFYGPFCQMDTWGKSWDLGNVPSTQYTKLARHSLDWKRKIPKSRFLV